MIRIEQLAATHGSFTLGPVDLTVGSGQCCVLLGPSGAGKTMFLETVLGLRKPGAGRVVLDGRDITRLPPEDRQVAYIPQDVALFPHLSVRENILFGRRMRKTLPGSAHDMARLAAMLDIRHLLERRSIATLSGGERQRVALARALIIGPKVLFLDESFAALDAPIRRQILSQFRQLQQTLGLTVIAVTHSHEQATILGDKLAVMIAGRLVQTAGSDELFTNPATHAVARLLGLRNLHRLTSYRVRGTEALCRVGDVQIVAQLRAQPIDDAPDRLFLWLPPEEILLHQPGQPPRPDEPTNRFCGRVEGIYRDGQQRYLRLNLGNGQGPIVDCPVSPRALRDHQPKAGDALEVEIPQSAVTLIPDV